MKPKIGIFGAGWVGLVTGACFAELGHEVVVRDVVPERIEALQAGRVPLHEPGLEELLERNRERLTFTLDVARTLEPGRSYEAMVRAAKQAGGELIDDNGRPLDDRTLAAIGAQIEAVRQELLGRGIEPGGPLAQRLFA